MNTVTSVLLRLLAGALALTVLAACGGGDDGADADSAPSSEAEAPASPSESAAEDYVEVPQGVTLSEAGSEFELRDTATVAWQPRQKQVAVADVTVRSVERTSFDEAFAGYRITDQMAAMTPYFVRARVVNPTGTNLGKVAVPIYLRDDAGTLVEETTLQGSFKPCTGGSLPKKFKKNAKTTVCLVFLLSQGRSFDSVAFQLPGGIEPVTWTGKATKYKAPRQGGDGNS
ncbi:hypothetical protein KUV85_07500 [Nocardioides panacisoli]|uniref:hypothetical protein n=1 Tax=Nocardioides panacisoli TaxID=627624 RepID=UPI001C630C0F|nr:hypothetical protein [Nocardioides panacisoli]QYJ05513.1 hypothetical protein KUV85_07500 [Nocardioides panacisoli]